MGAIPPIPLIGAIVACVGELLHIIGLATPNWVKSKALDATTGLFRSCISDTCTDIDDPSSTRDAVRAMCILGMIAGLGAAAAGLIYVLLTILSKSTHALFGLVALGCGVAAFVFTIIGVIVFGSEIYNGDFMDYGFSFGLIITGGILLLAGGIVFFMGTKSRME